MNNVIDLASVRAARRAAVCTFEILGEPRRLESTVLVTIDADGDEEAGKELFALASDLRAASLDAWKRRMPIFDFATREHRDDGVPMPPVEFELELSGAWWLESYMTLGHALELQQQCAARGMRLAG